MENDSEFEEFYEAWPGCPVEGCTNKVCLSLNSDKCFPHTEGSQYVKRWKIEARNTEAILERVT